VKTRKEKRYVGYLSRRGREFHIEDRDNTLRRSGGTELPDYNVPEVKSSAKLFKLSPENLLHPYKRIMEYITSLFYTLTTKGAKNET
jgi:hypothetical protein